MDITELLLKKLEEKLSPEEEKAFEDWLSTSDENRSLFFRLKALKDRGAVMPDLTNLDAQEAWARVFKQFSEKYNQRHRNKKTFRLKSVLKYAAIFLAVFGFGYWTFTFKGDTDTVDDTKTITLQLDNGEIKIISVEKAKTITDNYGNILKTGENTELNYSNVVDTKELVYNILKVPNGKKFKLILSDGSIVHLNAGSSLKYPVKFLKDGNRHVFLKGEGYFDISEDKQHPFLVTAGNMDVKVLGTAFNISSYPEDNQINTVLVRGSVGLSRSDSISEAPVTILSPGHKAVWNRSDEKVQVEKVNTDVYTGWIEGKLILQGLSFENIIKKLQRHYNISISNQYEKLNNQIFTATFDTETIEEVLNSFQVETPFEYELRDGKIIIYEPGDKKTEMPMR